MREKLRLLGSNKRHTFTGIVERFGWKSAFKGPDIRTLLLRKVKNGDIVVADHLWFTLTKGFEKCDLKVGDIVQFDGRVSMYTKGYKGYRDDYIACSHPVEDDYRIERPTNISIIKRAE